MEAVTFFKCLSDETRLNIVLLVNAHQELCVCDLTEKLQLSQPKISRHLALLRASGLLQDRRQGQWVYYSIAKKLPSWCYEILTALNTQTAPIFPSLQSLVSKSCCD